MEKEKVNIIQVSFVRKFNLGNYETEDVGFVATCAQGQNPEEILKVLDDSTKSYRRKQKEKD
jgi:hypothetical protein